MTPRRRPCPLWFRLLVAVAWAVALRALDHALGGGAPRPDGAPPVQLAFWGFLLGIAEWIWNGFQAAGAATLQFLVWAYGALSAAVGTLVNGLATAGHALLVGLKRVWDFFGTVYRDVLKPLALKVWGWFNKLTSWLDRTFRPVIEFLQRLRNALTQWWATWVRPWLDLIDVTRKLLHTLSALGLAWARALDARLAAIEAAIEKPFRFVLAQLNEVIDVINRVMTIDGLVQRVALVRSVARDYAYVWKAIADPWRANFDHNTTPPLDAEIEPRTASQIASAYGDWIHGGGGTRAVMYGAITDYVRRTTDSAR